MSGHSKWSTIKRKKGATDAKRSKVWTKVVKEITIAARLGGGDPAGNPRLRRALDLARSVNMPAENLARAVKKGTGELEGVAYDEIVYEASGAGGCFFVIEIMTDNRNRTAAELRKIFEKHSGQLGAAGAAAWAFDAKGLLSLARTAASEELLVEIAASAGADDIRDDGERWTVLTPVEHLEAVREALVDAGLEPLESSLTKLPKNVKSLRGRDAEVGLNLLETLDDHDDVQKVYTDFEAGDDGELSDA